MNICLKLRERLLKGWKVTDMINFCTLYPKGREVELYKDSGQIPYTLDKREDVCAKLVCCRASLKEAEKGGFSEKQFKQISMLLNNETVTGLIYIFKYGRQVDWFNFYHGGRHAYYWSKLYKFLNPKGKVYLKLDLNYDGCRLLSENKKELEIFEKAAKAADIVSVESEQIRKLCREFTDVDMAVICNGYVDNTDTEAAGTLERENCFITVGRLGTYEKATDLLLEAFAESAAEHDWKLKLVGSIEPAFMQQKEAFYEKYPRLKERVIFTGPISDKKKLYEMYSSARVFVLPSRYEGFPLVGPEALHCGCRMILSDAVPPVKELTNNKEYGVVVKTNDVSSLKEAFVQESKRAYSGEEVRNIIQYAEKTLSWDRICAHLYELMAEKM